MADHRHVEGPQGRSKPRPAGSVIVNPPRTVPMTIHDQNQAGTLLAALISEWWANQRENDTLDEGTDEQGD